MLCLKFGGHYPYQNDLIKHRLYMNILEHVVKVQSGTCIFMSEDMDGYCSDIPMNRITDIDPKQCHTI